MGAHRSREEHESTIVAAAFQVVADGGIQALTHRAVAAEAAISVSLTTYYYRDLGDILYAMFDRATEDDAYFLEEFLRSVHAGLMQDRVVELVTHFCTQRRPFLAVRAALFAAALHRPDLQPLMARWDHAVADRLGGYLEAEQLRALLVAIEGIFVTVLGKRLMSSQEILDIVHRALARM